MNEGRELDAIVHEKIFGKCGHVLSIYKKDNRNWSDDYTTYRCKKCKTETFRGLSYHEGKTVCPQYSTDIADAWLVLDYLENNGYEYNLVFESNYYMLDLYRNGYKFQGDAETAPLAICIAALKSCGVKVEE